MRSSKYRTKIGNNTHHLGGHQSLPQIHPLKYYSTIDEASHTFVPVTQKVAQTQLEHPCLLAWPTDHDVKRFTSNDAQNFTTLLYKVFHRLPPGPEIRIFHYGQSLSLPLSPLSPFSSPPFPIPSSFPLHALLPSHPFLPSLSPSPGASINPGVRLRSLGSWGSA